ncbi:16S rRNA (cytosine(1402)-N(4))-methyltransferase RsmH [Leptolinea tardivitalis]|uniref:Ribosomal RNA small subunit methyltransferase H n=1 Tax=Leptolinea tardivitalis TaxID=229920 RepID=A0A0P6WYW4_9CHLR|nr:16S rRNA (cytosine(1402)-N(4))-methyltransferase RsmH [Leptolinea tardivitalis]KPL71888.1 16S rRNA methyltransferase [Leptolinea tardivitalis]GAP20296.1 16S rRNA (cytosine(1402)-N(4))-methyltransferase [Leptolinea tardivitalis]
MSDSSRDAGIPHQPVLYQPSIDALQPHDGGRYVDATLGAGGHARGILQYSSPTGQLLGLDRDESALSIARQRLSEFSGRTFFRHSSYVQMKTEVEKLGWSSVDGILMDLGLSSMQLDTPERGFSFRTDNPLDMRFDPTTGLSAADLVNTYREDELSRILWEYGEEPKSRRIASAIVQNRPITTTGQLAALVSRVYGPQRGEHHPATRTFQAIRIAVNDELGGLQNTLPIALSILKPGGRLAIITFHSLEDRIVKQFFQKESKDCLCPPSQPICTCGHKASIRLVQRKPVNPTNDEIKENPRARSARLRIAEKL